MDELKLICLSGPVGLPIIGNVLDVKRLVDKTKFHYLAWEHLAKDYGPVVGLRLGLAEPLILVSGRKAVLEMLSRQEFDGRPLGFMFRFRTGGIRRGVIFTDGQAWTDHRRFALKTLKNFGYGKLTMEDIIIRNAVALTKIIDERSKEGPIDNMRRITSVAVLNNLWTFVTGFSYDLDQKNEKLMDVIDIMDEIVKDSDICGGLLNFFPFLRHFIPGPVGFKRHCQRLERLRQFFADEVAEHRETREKEESRDLIDEYLSIMEKQNLQDSTRFDEEQLIALVKDFFSAGLETTNNTIGFILAYITVNQEVQQKIHSEIDTVIGKDILPSISHKSRMHYLNATIAEVSRLSTVGPTSIPHRAIIDTSFLGFKIKKNYTMLANLTSVHMDEQYWGDPANFRPERFINAEGCYFDDPWLIQFGIGRRRCLGENLARNSLFLFLTCLLQKFNFQLTPNANPSLVGFNGFTISPPQLNMIVTKRF
ncbi:methyl farnesoate epoxidase-like [Prorops nasuta]|uniref:methyl farnesoate epoxidase-like n=1 Tax=Prorops nasuta TaxID=863751 RepID=UPI0034CDC4B7